MVRQRAILPLHYTLEPSMPEFLASSDLMLTFAQHAGSVKADAMAKGRNVHFAVHLGKALHDEWDWHIQKGIR